MAAADRLHNEPVGIGLVGVGGFGEFCLEAFAAMPEVRIAAVADVDRVRADKAGARYGAAAYTDLDALLGDDTVQIVALNTPPHLHAPQGLACLRAGKHLFCEKPLALTVEEGEALLAAARENNLRLTVDYVMRHNPFWKAAASIAHSGALGALRHMELINHANGLALAPTHWFWDKAKSGGIWVEHGVHFFDAFAWVSGQSGEVIAATEYARSDGAIDRVEALLRYGDVAAHCYHAFDQNAHTEHTMVQLAFERGRVELHQWVPTNINMVLEVPDEIWKPIWPQAFTSVVTSTSGNLSFVGATFPELNKSALYTQAIQDGMRDLVNAIRDPNGILAVTGEMGLASLQTAIATERITRRVIPATT